MLKVYIILICLCSTIGFRWHRLPWSTRRLQLQQPKSLRHTRLFKHPTIDIDSFNMLMIDEEEVYDDPMDEMFDIEQNNPFDDTIQLEDLKGIWTDYCQTNNITDANEAMFTIEKVLPLVMKDDMVLRIEEDCLQKEIRIIPHYWSNEDLKDLWNDWSPDPPTLKSANFSFSEAWSLVPSNPKFSLKLSDDIITENELREIWQMRAETTLGMPDREFNIIDALKIITPRSLEIDNTVYESYYETKMREQVEGPTQRDYSHIDDPAVLEIVKSFDEKLADMSTVLSLPRPQFSVGRVSMDRMWQDQQITTWSGDEQIGGDDELYSAMFGDREPMDAYEIEKELEAGLEEENNKEAGKSTIRSLTLDEVRQDLMDKVTISEEDAVENKFRERELDVGFGDSFDDPELEHELEVPPWEYFNISDGSEPNMTTQAMRDRYFDQEDARVTLLLQELETKKKPRWWDKNDTYVRTKKIMKDEDDFFNHFNVKEDPHPLDFPGINGIRAKHYDYDGIRRMWDRFPELPYGQYYPMHPREYFDFIDEQEERYTERIAADRDYDDCVDAEVSKHYDPMLFEGSGDVWNDEDECCLRSMEFIMNTTDLYLTDHEAVSKANDESMYQQMLEYKELYGLPEIVKEPIPDSMTPDKHRGVNYSMTIIESYANRELAPWEPESKDLYANETWEVNENAQTMCTIGTVRVQYDWSRSDNSTFSIDPKIADLLEPIQEYANTLIELQSTANGVVIYDYLGPIRHIIGLRACLLYMAEEYYPEIKDLRLETERQVDPRDLGDEDTM